MGLSLGFSGTPTPPTPGVRLQIRLVKARGDENLRISLLAEHNRDRNSKSEGAIYCRRSARYQTVNCRDGRRLAGQVDIREILHES
jgi:hypothetical protein